MIGMSVTQQSHAEHNITLVTVVYTTLTWLNLNAVVPSLLNK